MRLFYFRSVPGEHECPEALWSRGRSCRDSYVACYRAGWDSKRVNQDNRELVKRKREERDGNETNRDDNP